MNDKSIEMSFDKDELGTIVLALDFWNINHREFSSSPQNILLMKIRERLRS